MSLSELTTPRPLAVGRSAERATVIRLAAVLVVSSALLVAACTPTSSAPPPAPCPLPGAPDPQQPLGSVDGIPITRAELSARALAELEGIDNEAMQRRLHLEWVALDEAVGTRLLAREAERRGLTLEALTAAEVEAKLVDPSEEEVAALYEANRDSIPVPFEVVAGHIRRELRSQRREELQRAFVGRLREAAEVRYSLSVPELPRYDVEAGSSPSLGPAGARVVVIEFSDFECPYCGRASQTLAELKRLFPDSLRLVFRNFPLGQHTHARAAAEAAQCAHEQGKFWPYHDLLFDNASALGAEALRKYAGEVALDLPAFEACLASERPKAVIEADEQAARRLELDGTPSIFIGGIKLIGILPLPVMAAIVEHELGRAQ